jgi:hypothetical protein
MRTRYWVFVASLALPTLGGGVTTWAAPPPGGTRADVDVVIDKSVPGTFIASGSLGTARGSNSTMAKEIGCSADDYRMVTCTAVLNKVQAQCVVQDTDIGFTLLLGTLKGDSFLEFSATGSDDPTVGWTCDYILVDNNSKYLPKMP